MIIRTIDGCPFDPAEPVWHVRTPTEKLLFNFDLPTASGALREEVQRAVGCLLRVARPELVHEVLKRCRVFIRHASLRTGNSVETLNVYDFETYESKLDPSQKYLARITLDSIKLLVSVGFKGLAEDLRLELLRLHVAPLKTASPANMACPCRGPLTSEELAVVLRELTKAYECQRVGLASFSLALLMLMLAPRPGQIALLKVGDLVVSHGPGVERLYSLAMPLLKVPRTGKSARRDRLRPLHACLGAVLAQQSAEAIAWGAGRGISPSGCPLFPADAEQNRRSKAYPDLAWTIGHDTGNNLSARAIRTFGKLDLSSMRSKDEQRQVTATRLRRSLATIARGAGASYAQVGNMLWHSSAASAHIYTGPSGGLMLRVEAAIDFRPLANLYRRELTATQADFGMVAR